MKHVPIIGKFLIILAVFGVFVIGAAVYATSNMHNIDAEYSAMNSQENAASLNASRAGRFVVQANAAIEALAIARDQAGNDKAMASLSEARAKFTSYMEAAIKAQPADGELRDIEASSLRVIEGDCARAVRLGDTGVSEADIAAAQHVYLDECEPKFAAPVNAISTKILALTDTAKAKDDALTMGAKTAIFTTYAIILGGLLLVAAFAFWAIREWIVKPIFNMSRTMEVIGGGDTGIDIPCRFRKDELGKMGIALEGFRLAAIEKVALEAHTADARKAAEAERAKNEAEAARIRGLSDSVVAGVGQSLSAMARGDLTQRFTAEVHADVSNLQSLKDDLNGAVDQLRTALGQVASTAEGIRSGTGEIGQAADDLSRRTEQQAASLEETAAALDEITATVRKTAEGAHSARDTVSQAKADAERSGEVVRSAVAAMSEIEGSARQISQIIGVIDEIAFQTNLLALNAGVEAARAGDAGRGFAVVASEVRALAQRSADAAKEIKTLISASSQQVERGVELVGQTGKALDRIVTQVSQISGVVSEIASSAQEQAAGLQQVNTAVNQMDQVTQQNAAMVEQSTAASHALKGEAHELAKLVGKFQLGAQAQAAMAPRAAPAARAAASAPRSAMRTVAPRGGAAAKPAPEPAGADDSWEEF